MSLTVEAALAAMETALAGRAVLPAVTLPLADALGCTLAADVTSPIDQPPFPRSPLDGYAVRAADLADASREHPAVFKVVSRQYAGMAATRAIGAGEAARIMTGGVIPQGADCVVRQEDSDEGEETASLYVSQKPWSNYVYQGEDFKAGTVLLHRGTVLDAAALAVCAASGACEVAVCGRPRVAVLSTGDELRQPGEALPAGKIYDSNQTYMTARLRQLGCEPVLCRAVGDDTEAIAEAVREASKTADLILTTGGVSVGVKDLLPAVLDKLGAHTVFHGVAMKPGMPTLFALTADPVPVMGLSGNPFAAAVAFELLTRPLLALLSGNEAFGLRRAHGRLVNDFGKPSGCRRFIRATLENGQIRVPDGQSNGVMRSMVGCNCLVDVPAGSGALDAGDEAEVILL